MIWLVVFFFFMFCSCVSACPVRSPCVRSLVCLSTCVDDVCSVPLSLLLDSFHHVKPRRATIDSAIDGASKLSRVVLRVLESYRVAPARRSAVDAPADGRGVVRIKAQQLLKCMHGG